MNKFLKLLFGPSKEEMALIQADAKRKWIEVNKEVEKIIKEKKQALAELDSETGLSTFEKRKREDEIRSYYDDLGTMTIYRSIL